MITQQLQHKKNMFNNTIFSTFKFFYIIFLIKECNIFIRDKIIM